MQQGLDRHSQKQHGEKIQLITIGRLKVGYKAEIKNRFCFRKKANSLMASQSSRLNKAALFQISNLSFVFDAQIEIHNCVKLLQLLLSDAKR